MKTYLPLGFTLFNLTYENLLAVGFHFVQPNLRKAHVLSRLEYRRSRNAPRIYIEIPHNGANQIIIKNILKMLFNHLKKSLLLTALFSLLLTSCSNNSNNNPEKNSENKKISIGIAVAQTSNIALIGQEQIAGAKIAEKYFNQQGGINGIPLELILQDTGKDEAGAINAFQILINKNNVVAIIGPTTSQQAFSSDPIAEKAKVPVISPSNIAKGIPEIGDYISRIAAPADQVAPMALQSALKLNPHIKKVGILYAQDQEALVYESKIFQQQAKQQKLDIVTVQKYQITDSDFQSYATKTINSKPDLVIISGQPADGGNLVKQLRELGYKGLIIGGNGFNSANLFPVCQKLCEGIIVAQAYNPDYNNPINQVFSNTYKQQYQKQPPQFTAQMFTAIQVVVEALKTLDQKQKISTLSLPQLRTALNQTILKGKYETPLGEISFNSVGDVLQKQFYVAIVKMDKEGTNGKFDFLK
jgi:branched-chain amino acid transport system substrate-binding protein